MSRRDLLRLCDLLMRAEKEPEFADLLREVSALRDRAFRLEAEK